MRKLINLGIVSVTILTINLIVDYAMVYFLGYRGITSPLKFTALGMIFLVIIFYPLIALLDKKVAFLTRKVTKHGKYVFGRNLGILLMFAVLFFILFCIYAHHWFNLNVLKIILSSL